MRDLPTGTGRAPNGLRWSPILLSPLRIAVKFAAAPLLEGQLPVETTLTMRRSFQLSSRMRRETFLAAMAIKPIITRRNTRLTGLVMKIAMSPAAPPIACLK